MKKFLLSALLITSRLRMLREEIIYLIPGPPEAEELG